MFSRILLSLALSVATATAAELELGQLDDIAGVERGGETLAREVSGATWHAGEMWVVDNEDDTNLLVMDAAGNFKPRKLPAGAAISDLEGITSDGTHLYVMAGGGLSNSGKLDPRRFALVRLTLTGGKLSGARTLDQLGWLRQFGKELELDFEKAKGPDGDKVKVIEDVKLEGLAMAPGGRLLVGLRKPLVKDKSMVVELRGYREAFDMNDASLLKASLFAKLDLDGAGVSSLEHDPVTGNMLALAIHAGKLKTDMWVWKPGSEPRRVGKLRGHKAEGIARMGRTSRVLILADDEDEDGTKMGRFGFVELK